MNVLPTAVEFNLPVTWCILDDNALGSIWDIQRQAYGGRYMATEFGYQPDFAAIARACNYRGENVDNPDEIDAALCRALQAIAGGRAEFQCGQGTPGSERRVLQAMGGEFGRAGGDRQQGIRAEWHAKQIDRLAKLLAFSQPSTLVPIAE